MDQHIGALIDKMFFIGFGLFMLFANPKAFCKDIPPEAAAKRKKTLRICGALSVTCGVTLLILMLFEHA